jgi:hypothetical protein
MVGGQPSRAPMDQQTTPSVYFIFQLSCAREGKINIEEITPAGLKGNFFKIQN